MDRIFLNTILDSAALPGYNRKGRKGRWLTGGLNLPGPATKAASVQDSGRHYHSRVGFSAADAGDGIMILVGVR